MIWGYHYFRKHPCGDLPYILLGINNVSFFHMKPRKMSPENPDGWKDVFSYWNSSFLGDMFDMLKVRNKPGWEFETALVTKREKTPSLFLPNFLLLKINECPPWKGSSFQKEGMGWFSKSCILCRGYVMLDFHWLMVVILISYKLGYQL